jgi:transposase
MSGLNLKEKRILVKNFFEKNKANGKAFTVKYFQKLGISRRTVYNIISLAEKGASFSRKVGSGRKSWKINKSKILKIAKSVDGKTGISQRKIARKYNISQPYVSKILKKQKIRYFKRQKAPYKKKHKMRDYVNLKKNWMNVVMIMI